MSELKHLLIINFKSGHQIRIMCDRYKFEKKNGKIIGYEINGGQSDLFMSIDQIESFESIENHFKNGTPKEFFQEKWNNFLNSQPNLVVKLEKDLPDEDEELDKEAEKKIMKELQRLHARWGTEKIIEEMEYDGPFWTSVSFDLHEYDYDKIREHLAMLDKHKESE